MALVNNAETIGKGTKNLVLETAGHIYVKVNERYYELDFRNSGEKLVGKPIIENVQTPEEIDLSEYITNDDLKKVLKILGRCNRYSNSTSEFITWFWRGN